MKVELRICLTCGKSFWWATRNGYDPSKGKYCSRECYYETLRYSPTMEYLEDRIEEVKRIARKYTLTASAQFLGVDRKALKKFAQKHGIVFEGKRLHGYGWR